jgi:hypothetical protein
VGGVAGAPLPRLQAVRPRDIEEELLAALLQLHVRLALHVPQLRTEGSSTRERFSADQSPARTCAVSAVKADPQSDQQC